MGMMYYYSILLNLCISNDYNSHFQCFETVLHYLKEIIDFNYVLWLDSFISDNNFFVSVSRSSLSLVVRMQVTKRGAICSMFGGSIHVWPNRVDFARFSGLSLYEKDDCRHFIFESPP